MILQTTSEVISLSGKLENELACFYEELSRTYTEDEATFISFAKENRDDAKRIQRVYQEVISDAIEGCFAFNINTSEYSFILTRVEGDSYSEVLGKIINAEERMSSLYSVAAEQSMTLLADVPRTLAKIAERKKERLMKLRALINDRK